MTQSEVPESRTYRHVKCNSLTVIAGQAFEVASNPLSDMERTWCNDCNTYFPISEFVWEDTGETISDYYARLGANATSLERFLCSKTFLFFCMAVGFILGAIAGYALSRNDIMLIRIAAPPFVGGIGVIVAGALNISLLGKLITRRVCGVSDTRLLK